MSIFEKLSDMSDIISDVKDILAEKQVYINNLRKDMEKSNTSPSIMRNVMNRSWNAVERSSNEFLRIREIIHDSTRQLNELNPIINTVLDNTDFLKKHLNKLQVGTLEGLVRGKIKKEGIVPEPDNYTAQEILEQHYNEGEVLNRGGKRKRRKTKKSRNIKTRNTRKNFKFAFTNTKKKNPMVLFFYFLFIMQHFILLQI